jgi:hypothetical protein
MPRPIVDYNAQPFGFHDHETPALPGATDQDNPVCRNPSYIDGRAPADRGDTWQGLPEPTGGTGKPPSIKARIRPDIGGQSTKQNLRRWVGYARKNSPQPEYD